MVNDDILEGVPEGMAKAIVEGHEVIFGEPLLESEREINRMTRENVYRSMAHNFMTVNPMFRNRDPEELIARLRVDLARPVPDFIRDAAQRMPQEHQFGAEYGPEAFTNERGHVLTCMEDTLNTIRRLFFRDPNINRKYMPGVTRIAMLLPECGGCGIGAVSAPEEISRLYTFLEYVNEVCPDPEAEGAQFDVNLNGMTLEDIDREFGEAEVDPRIQRKIEAVRNYRPANHVREYHIEEIPDFEHARRFLQYTPTSPWCIANNRNQWENHSVNGMNTVYFCYKDGFEDVPAEPGPDTPLDEYGLSLFCVIVDPNGLPFMVTTRWNEGHGGTDFAMQYDEVSELVGMPFMEAFPAHPNLDNPGPMPQQGGPGPGLPMQGGRMMRGPRGPMPGPIGGHGMIGR